MQVYETASDRGDWRVQLARVGQVIQSRPDRRELGGAAGEDVEHRRGRRVRAWMAEQLPQPSAALAVRRPGLYRRRRGVAVPGQSGGFIEPRPASR